MPLQPESVTAAGSIHLLTIVPRRRWPWLMDTNVILRLIRLYERALTQRQVICLGYVWLPDRFVSLVESAHNGPAVARAMTDFQRESALIFRGLFPEGPLWRTRYEDQPLSGEGAFAELERLHRTPVERGLATASDQYRWSSAADYRGTGPGLITVTPLAPAAAIPVNA